MIKKYTQQAGKGFFFSWKFNISNECTSLSERKMAQVLGRKVRHLALQAWSEYGALFLNKFGIFFLILLIAIPINNNFLFLLRDNSRKPTLLPVKIKRTAVNQKNLFNVTKLAGVSTGSSKDFISQITIHHRVRRHVATISLSWQKGKKSRDSSLFVQIFLHKAVRKKPKAFLMEAIFLLQASRFVSLCVLLVPHL